MTDPLRVILEIGKQPRRIVAAAMDWPGLDRWGRTEEEAIATMLAYLPRYAAVAGGASLADAFAGARSAEVQVVERVPGSSSTDWWGVAHVPSRIEAEPLAADELERRLGLLQAAWDHFDEVAGRVSGELRTGPRGGGRPRDRIIVHVYASERHNFWRKVGIREPDEKLMTPEELAGHRRRFLEAIRAYHAEGRPARAWPIRFLIRRTAQHVMDHAWEMEDRNAADE